MWLINQVAQGIDLMHFTLFIWILSFFFQPLLCLLVAYIWFCHHLARVLVLFRFSSSFVIILLNFWPILPDILTADAHCYILLLLFQVCFSRLFASNVRLTLLNLIVCLFNVGQLYQGFLEIFNSARAVYN